MVDASVEGLALTTLIIIMIQNGPDCFGYTEIVPMASSNYFSSNALVQCYRYYIRDWYLRQICWAFESSCV